MRVFVASFVEPLAAERLARAVPVIAGMRPVPAENLHLTLHFLGSIDDAERDGLIAFVRALEGTSLTARIEAIAGFPSAGRARTVVALLDQVEVLDRWRDALAHGYPTADSQRPFRPHITLGRSRKGVRVPTVDALAGTAVPLLPPRVYESQTLPEGARYRALD